MNTDYFKDIYKDFFGVEKNDAKEIKNESSQETMTTIINKINKLYIM